MQHRDRQIINKLIHEVEIINKLTEGMNKEAFLSDEKTQRAVSMTLINIGELVKTLSDEIKKENNHIPWKLISGLRDITAQKYQTLNMGDIWQTIKDDIPQLSDSLVKL